MAHSLRRALQGKGEDKVGDKVGDKVRGRLPNDSLRRRLQGWFDASALLLQISFDLEWFVAY